MPTKKSQKSVEMLDVLGRPLAVDQWVTTINKTGVLAIKQISGFTKIQVRMRNGTKKKSSPWRAGVPTTYTTVDNYLFQPPHNVCLIDDNAVAWARLSGKL